MPEQIIYLVSEGEYSGYSIEAAFSTRAMADKYVALQGGDSRVEEYVIDLFAPQIRKGLYPFCLQMERDGELFSIPYCSLTRDEEPLHVVAYLRGGGFFLRGTVMAKDAAHAAKIANEKRVQLIANNEWKEGAGNA